MPRSLEDLAWPLVTPRLSIRRVTSGDAAAMWSYRRLPEVHRWLPSAPADQAAFAALLAEPVRQERTLVVAVGDAIVGDLYLSVNDSWAMAEAPGRAEARDAEIGWAFDIAAQGRGLATEAVRALLARCFEELGVHRVTAVTFADNVASWRLMERVGMRRETAARRDALHRDGRWYDSLGYALLADEWPP
ncbi:MAG: GNAT family protein [Nocardioides sp.]